MLVRKSFKLPCTALSLAATLLGACTADRGLPGDEGQTTEVTAAAESDPDGYLTPDFGSPFLPPGIKALSDAVSAASGYYSKAKSAYDVINLGLQALGILDPVDPDAQFKAVEEAIAKLVSAADVHDTMFFIDTQRGKADWAVGRIKVAGGTLAEGGNEDQSSGEAARTIIEPDDAAFYRVDNPTATHGLWKSVVPDRPETIQGVDAALVYDWRLGAPALLEVIAKRVAVIAAMDQNFRWDHRYDDQLRSYREAIQRNYNKMLDGIRCVSQPTAGRALGLGQVCADIYTGVYTFEPFSQWTRFPTFAEENQILQLLKSELIRGMPLFQMQRMIDTLTLYIDAQQDFTEVNSEIRLSRAQDLCLDVQGGNPNPGTTVWIWPCNALSAQWWVYDRLSGQIRNAAFGVCLDVLPRQTWFSGQSVQPTPGIMAGAGVVTNGCDGTGGQKWTWDPDSETMQNEYGMVLNAVTTWPNPAPVAQATVNVTTGPPAGLAGQHWLAVQKDMGRRAGLLWRYSTGELRLWDMISGWRYQDVAIGSASLDWQPIATGDFNADGHGDILWQNGGWLSLWNLKSTTVTAMTPATSNAPGAKPLVGDVDGDGVSDLLFNIVGGSPPTDEMATWLMNPGSTLPREVSSFSSQSYSVVALGNFDGDIGNHADQIRIRNDATVTIALSTGSSYSFTVGTTAWTIPAVGDFNGDGTTDILWFKTDSFDVAISPVIAGQPQAGVVIGTVPASSGWSILGVADVDNDGISDIVWRHTDGTVGFWMMSDPSTIREYTTLPLSPDVSFAGTIVLGPQKG
jgi:hypothetical protein